MFAVDSRKSIKSVPNSKEVGRFEPEERRNRRDHVVLKPLVYVLLSTSFDCCNQQFGHRSNFQQAKIGRRSEWGVVNCDIGLKRTRRVPSNINNLLCSGYLLFETR